jgi:hypothetical protein
MAVSSVQLSATTITLSGGRVCPHNDLQRGCDGQPLVVRGHQHGEAQRSLGGVAQPAVWNLGFIGDESDSVWAQRCQHQLAHPAQLARKLRDAPVACQHLAWRPPRGRRQEDEDAGRRRARQQERPGEDVRGRRERQRVIPPVPHGNPHGR